MKNRKILPLFIGADRQEIINGESLFLLSAGRATVHLVRSSTAPGTVYSVLDRASPIRAATLVSEVVHFEEVMFKTLCIYIRT